VTFNSNYQNDDNTRLTDFFQDNPRKLVPECLLSRFYWSRRMTEVVVTRLESSRCRKILHILHGIQLLTTY